MSVLKIEDYTNLGISLAYFSLTAWIIWKIWVFFTPRDSHSVRSVAVLVLGDIGRSPRMMYHAESFAENAFITEVIGYGGSKPIPALERLPRVQLRYLPEPPEFLRFIPFIVAAPIKVSIQVVSILLELLVRIPKAPEFILVQNPPSIPTLALVWLVGCIRGSKVIIDWHNLGYSILALKVGKTHPLVKISEWFEKTFGRCAYAHLFVTKAMRDYLVEKWDLQGRKAILHDRPPHHFHRASSQETHELFRRLQIPLMAHKDLQGFLPQSSLPYSTAFTQVVPPSHSKPSSRSKATVESAYTEVQLPTVRPDRPALVVSSTSWTPDEEFGILLEALTLYEVHAQNAAKQSTKSKLPKVLMVVTGKGPMRDSYIQKVTKLQKTWEYVRCVSLWLEAEDYPILLGSADLGVSLHSSSSDLDLPMKVVDMFGCKLPVCALDFKCLGELVQNDVNGLVFKNASQLAEQFVNLLEGFPNSTPRLNTLRTNLINAASSSRGRSPQIASESDWYWGSWDENWNSTVKPLLFRTLP
ncbi:mannosyltransferase [Pluteus cervinus]|uniref:Mannosyltransferase n=1 Tax=Pluteus cervinus TaxID=181527 RepID=A0ACD3BEN5_9AGAR|nr:mannosyltransferase [Pluteus cervinus]